MNAFIFYAEVQPIFTFLSKKVLTGESGYVNLH